MVAFSPMNAEMERLDPRYVAMSRASGWIWSAVMSVFWLGVVLTVAWLSEAEPRFRSIALVVWGVLAIAHTAWNQYKPGLVYRNSSFRLDDDGIEIRRGLLFRSIISVPKSRVQHTDVSQGPFERRYGLGTLQIYTAGVTHAQVPLAGLSHQRAIEIRDALLPHERGTRA